MGIVKDLSIAQTTSRRNFLKVTAGAGGALVAGFHFGAGANEPSSSAEFIPSAYIRISPQGRVTFVVPFTEMGQGIFTATSMMLAEEMDLDLAQITVEQAPADESRYANPALGLQITGASVSIQACWKAVRSAGATCRAMLVTSAAETWKVPAEECVTRGGKVIHERTRRELTYGALARKAAALQVPKDVPVKDTKQYRLVGTPAKRVDARAKSDGSAKFGIDTRVPGMKYAAVAHCPVIGGKVRSVDPGKALAVRGVVRVLVADDIVGVVADHYGAARKGLAALEVSWEEGPNASFSTELWQQSVRGALSGKGAVTTAEGDFDKASASALRVIKADYDAPTMVHAPLEPMNCTLHFRNGRCDAWLGTQAPVKAQQEIARVSGVPVANIDIHNFLIGGGFGRRLDVEYVGQAAKLARQVDFPLKVIYSRDEDIRHGTFRPVYSDELAAAVDASGKMIAFSHRLAGSAIVARYAPQWMMPNGGDPDAVDAAEGPYTVPVKRVEFVAVEPPKPLITAFWRGVGCPLDFSAKSDGSDRQ